MIGIDLDEAEVITSVSTVSAAFTAFSLDLSTESSVVDGWALIEENHGIPDVLVNNAASKSSDVRAFFRPFEETVVSVWDEVMSVNLTGMMLMCREHGRRMRAADRGGSIINIASVYAVVAPDQRIYEGSSYPDLGGAINTPAVYSASKAGVLGLTRHLAAYWGQSRIRVNAISPGGISSGQNETFRTRYSSRVPIGRMADAKEIDGALIYLASDASSYVTGQNIVVDGGLSAW